MGAGYDPVESIERFLVGTPPVLGGYGGAGGRPASPPRPASSAICAPRARALTAYADRLTDAWLAPLGFALASPAGPGAARVHVTLHHPQAWQICQALKAAGVIPDFRTPERLRIGLAPLYTRFVDVYEGMARLRDIVTSGSYREFEAAPGRVT